MDLEICIRQPLSSSEGDSRPRTSNYHIGSLPQSACPRCVLLCFVKYVLQDALIDGDPLLRRASSEAIGRLANISGSSFLTSQAKVFVDHIFSNRDPQGRAGCALAFGALYSHVGGLAAAPILKTTVNILMSLSNDPHPLVHFWSLTALARVINAASLAFTSFVPTTLGMLVKIYMSEPHETEGGTLNNANISGDLQAFPVVCRIIDAIITILGPDVQESSRTRSLVLDLVQEFSFEDDEDILIEDIKCTQHLLMFAPSHVNIPDTVTRFRSHLTSSRRQLKLAAIDALYQLVQKDALVMSRLGGDGLVEDLFAMLDGDPSIQGVKSVISSWLSQTAIHNPSAWIDLCQRIMLRTNASQKAVNAANTLDDEGQSLNASVSAANTAQEGIASTATSRWRTQLFALECLHTICTTVAGSGRKEHTDVLFAKSNGFPIHGLLVSRIPDLIKMAFTASAAYVMEIRLEGLVVLRDIIQVNTTYSVEDILFDRRYRSFLKPLTRIIQRHCYLNNTRLRSRQLLRLRSLPTLPQKYCPRPLTLVPCSLAVAS